MTKPDITDFLRARIVDDKAAARGAMGAPAYPQWGDTAAEETLAMALGEGCAPEGAKHFARWGPARVLAECEAKRRLVGLHAPRLTERGSAEGVNYRSCEICDPYPPMDAPDPGPCETIRLLTSLYADHHDYDESWRP